MDIQSVSLDGEEEEEEQEEEEFGPLCMNEGLLSVSFKDSLPSIQTTKKYRDHLCSKWKQSLIVKLLGRTIGYRSLLEKIQKFWNTQESFELIELGEGYFLVKFASIADLCLVLEGGPWTVFGHYLMVRLWKPEFQPTVEKVNLTSVCIQLPELPIEYYDDRVLFAIGHAVGETVMVNLNTHLTHHGKFARVCVEVDLTKPLVPRIEIDGRSFKIEYGGLRLICFHCGRQGCFHCERQGRKSC